MSTAELAGTRMEPVVRLRFSPYAPHATHRRMNLLDWVRDLPGRTWDPATASWEVSSFGPNPDDVLAAAGFELIVPTEGELAGVTELRHLYAPVASLDENRRTVLVRCRLAGYEQTQKLIGFGGVWDKKARVLRLPVSDVIHDGNPRPGVLWDEASLARAAAVQTHSPLLSPELAASAAAMSSASTPGSVAADIRAVQHRLGGPVGEFGLELYPYQVVGSYGVAAGHSLLADSPGIGKTVQAIAAATALRSHRLLVICPPVVLTNWAREISRTVYLRRALALSGAEDDLRAAGRLGEGGEVLPRNRWDRFPGMALFVQGRKEPELGADVAAVVISDSLLVARPHTASRVAEWLGEVGEHAVVVYDEAHRMKTMGSQRSNVALDIVARAPRARRIALTGTPVLAGPHELVPVLEFTGHLAPVFGGAGPFLQAFCRQDRYGAWHARKQSLGRLNQALNESVWVRRTKAQVLPQLPERDIVEVPLDVPLTEYRKAHKEVADDIAKWVKDFRDEHGRLPGPKEQEDFAQDSLRFISRLRMAAGLAKVPAATEMLTQALNDAPDEPILVWAHHVEVVKAMYEAATAAGVRCGVIAGGTSEVEKQRLVDDFQAGELPVLVCSITAAGVGITLTRSHEALFVESDWTPALILQAIDRQHRIGQEHRITARMLLAMNTLDEHVQAKLAEKGETVSSILGDTSNRVAVGGERSLLGPRDIVLGMVGDAVSKMS